MTPSELAQKITERRMIHVPGHLGKFWHLLPYPDLYELLRHHIHPVIKEENLVFPDPETALEAGATVYFKNISRKLPNIGELLEGVKKVTQAEQAQAAIVLSRGSERGYDMHQDPFNLVILQCSGKKLWHVHYENFVWNDIISDGDMLLVPKNWWHVVHTVEPSTHITLQFT